MLYDQIVNLPHRWYRHCQADLRTGIPPMDFNAQIMKAAIPFRIDDVASHYYNHPADYAPDDFHNLAPRFPSMWFEFTQPKRGRVGDTWNDYEAVLKEAVGDELDITAIIRGIFVQSWDRYNEADTKAFRSFEIRESARWVYRSMVFFSLDGIHVSDTFSGMTWQVNDKGEIVHMGKAAPYIFDIPKVLAASVGIEEIKSHVTGSVMPVIMTLALLQHKDVSIGTITPRRKKKKVKLGTRRARRAAKKLPRDRSFHEHHIIQVNPLKPESVSGSGQDFGKKKHHLAQHQVAGGFRTYGGEDSVTGKQRGLLFGKRACTIFVPAYERGTDKDGTITKEFEVHNE